jgi:hypothetical protein
MQADNGSVHKRIERLREDVARAGWTRAGVHRLIAMVEGGGAGTRVHGSLRELLREDRFESGAARRDLARYLRSVAGAHPLGRARPSLEAAGTFEVDADRYRSHVEILSGEREACFADQGRLVFRDRFMPSARHQLDRVADWLSEYYLELGFSPRQEPVIWRGRRFWNVIVRIEGRSPDLVVLADHYDVADREPMTPRNRGQLARDHHLSPREIAYRIDAVPVGASVPGADDNASATAALMEMAQAARSALDRGVLFQRSIALAHLVGEELPADGVGAKSFLQHAGPIHAAIVLDMIGVDRTGKRRIQISPGRHPASLLVAGEVKRSIAELGLELRPVIRPFGARKSFLHQTDAVHFSRANLPVVLINEHLNDDYDLYRAGYHDEFDVPKLMDFRLACDVTRAALETTIRLASSPPWRGHPLHASRG